MAKKLPFGSIDLEALKDAPPPVQALVQGLVVQKPMTREEPLTRAEKQDRVLIKYAGRWRCSRCKGEWSSREQARAHFGCEAP